MEQLKEKNEKSKENTQRSFLRTARERRIWLEEHEKGEFERFWSQEEKRLQDYCRERRQEIFKKAQTPAFTAQKSHLNTVFIPIWKEANYKLRLFFDKTADRRIGVHAPTAQPSGTKVPQKHVKKFDPWVEGTKKARATKLAELPPYVKSAREGLDLEVPKFEGDIPFLLQTIAERKALYAKAEDKQTQQVALGLI